MTPGRRHTERAERAERPRDGEKPAPGSAKGRGVAAATLLLVLLAYVVLAYYGSGPHPKGMGALWWEPRGFLLSSGVSGFFGWNVRLAIAGLAAPAFLLAGGVYVLCRASLVRTVALWAALTTLLFLFYGLRQPGPVIWRFLGWRGTVVGLSFAATVAVAASAPLLAASWLRLGWWLRALLYLPLLALVVVLERNVTGTNPALPFNVSPWPVVPLFGFDGVASVVAGALGCLALILAAWRLRARSAMAALAGFAAAFAGVAGWIVLGHGGTIAALWVALLLGSLALVAVTVASGTFAKGARGAAGCIALGAVLLAIPIGVGRSWVRLDYDATRNHRAQRIIDALAAYQKQKQEYPDHLHDLAEAGLLKPIPMPRIGFRLFGREHFSYENFGNDYLLEFSAPGWVQCAYTPPWQEEPGEESGASSGEAHEKGESLAGSWSCPSKPPSLW